jgi:hypothetical protein
MQARPGASAEVIAVRGEWAVGEAGLLFRDRDGQPLTGITRGLAASTEAADFEVTFVAPALAASVSAWIFQGETGALLLDDLSLTATAPEGATRSGRRPPDRHASPHRQRPHAARSRHARSGPIHRSAGRSRPARSLHSEPPQWPRRKRLLRNRRHPSDRGRRLRSSAPLVRTSPSPGKTTRPSDATPRPCVDHGAIVSSHSPTSPRLPRSKTSLAGILTGIHQTATASPGDQVGYQAALRKKRTARTSRFEANVQARSVFAAEARDSVKMRVR